MDSQWIHLPVTGYAMGLDPMAVPPITGYTMGIMPIYVPVTDSHLPLERRHAHTLTDGARRDQVALRTAITARLLRCRALFAPLSKHAAASRTIRSHADHH